MMYRLFLFIVLLLCLCTDSFSQSKRKVSYKYLLYLPKDYAISKKRYPLVIYLHGGSHRGNDLDKLKAYGLPYLVDKGRDFDFIIAAPQCPVDKYWSTENWLDSLYSDLTVNYRIDTSRVYLTGISMGGYGTFIGAMDHPEKFAAIMPLCGGINDSDTARICRLRHVPVWTFHGTADDKVSISETERVVNGLKACKGSVKFTRLKGEGHGIEYLYETKPQIYKWLLTHKKQ